MRRAQESSQQGESLSDRDEGEEAMILDRNSKRPTPNSLRWLFGVPMVVVLLAAIVYAGTRPGFLSAGIFILVVAVLMYLYVRLVGAILKHRSGDRKIE